VFIKPNFTYPCYKEGVTTSPLAIEALVQVLRNRTSHITICESDGGKNAWHAEDGFAGHGVLDLVKRYGVRAMNLTEQSREVVTTEIAGHCVEVELAAPMLHECDVFITMPVPKVHVMTGVSLGFKNQWGCIPDVERLHHHPNFAHVVLAVNKLLRTRLTVFDGTYFLNRTGPMNGDPVPMNLVVVSDNPAAGDAGTALGVAYYIHHQLLGQPRTFVMNHAYTGPRFSNGRIAETLDGYGLLYGKLDDDQLVKRAAEIVAQGDVLRWFQGPMEWRPAPCGPGGVHLHHAGDLRHRRIVAAGRARSGGSYATAG